MNWTESLNEKAKKIRLIIFDVDGVLTDGKLYFTNEGQEFKNFHAQDGLGMVDLKSTGIEIGIITKRITPIVEHRMKELNITHVYQTKEDKRKPYKILINQLALTEDQVAYVGDDLSDLPLIRSSGIGVAVNNALPLVKQYADYVTEKNGGEGAAREICDKILEAQGLLTGIVERYL
jgi:3-deoxy-D-manno-octulosonate 8-phosphate phosphatase (KDO 8-P phosphatase)